MPTVRTTLRPDEETEVGDAEYLDLKRLGLLAETDEPPTPTPPAAPATKKTAAAPPASGTTKES